MSRRVIKCFDLETLLNISFSENPTERVRCVTLCNVVKQEVGCFLRLSLSFSSCSAAVFTHKPLVQSGGVRLIIFSALDLFNTRFPSSLIISPFEVFHFMCGPSQRFTGVNTED